MRRSPLRLVLAALVWGCGDASQPAPEDAPPYEPAADTAAIVRAAPAGPAEGAVTVEGRVVDAETGSGIPSAYFVILRPGVTPADWEASEGDSTAALMEAAVVSDSAGTVSVPDLPRGRRYTVMIAAAGYEPAVFDQGLAIRPDDSSPTRIEPVRLEPR